MTIDLNDPDLLADLIAMIALGGYAFWIIVFGLAELGNITSKTIRQIVGWCREWKRGLR